MSGDSCRPGLKPTVLTLQWPSDVDPSTLPDFESRARKLRYRSLGRACARHNIKHLLLGHHEDDQVETVLMRLALGHQARGLRGMKPSAPIPECFGIYGVRQSGLQSFTTRKELTQDSGPLQSEPGADQNDIEHVDLEGGDVLIHRPLLHFGKRRLEATCNFYGTKWVEDVTNQDPTLTTRNAVRHLLQNRVLPRALQAESLSKVADNMHRKLSRQEDKADDLFRRCKTIQFDARSGTMTIRLPNVAVRPGQRKQSGQYLQTRIIASPATISHMLRRLIANVSPQNNLLLEDVDVAFRHFYPQIHNNKLSNSRAAKVPKIFTSCSVYFRRMQSLAPHTDKSIRKLDPHHVWVLSRQPFPSSDLTPFTQEFPPNQQQQQSDYWSPFTLFDGRFWLRIQNSSLFPLALRPLRPADLHPFRKSLPPTHASRLNPLLEHSAPGHVRFTLPALFCGEGTRLVALPSLGVMIKDMEGLLRWDIRYKTVDLGEDDETVIVKDWQERRKEEGAVVGAVEEEGVRAGLIRKLASYSVEERRGLLLDGRKQ